MMEQDREQLCGPKHVPNPDRRAVRGGSTRGEVTLDGRRILTHLGLPMDSGEPAPEPAPPELADPNGY